MPKQKGTEIVLNKNQGVIEIFPFTFRKSCFFDEIININNLKNGIPKFPHPSYDMLMCYDKEIYYHHITFVSSYSEKMKKVFWTLRKNHCISIKLCI
jgi:hypothetical protein